MIQGYCCKFFDLHAYKERINLASVNELFDLKNIPMAELGFCI